MIISLCGNSNEKNILIKELKREYKDKVIICNYFNIFFQSVIENERIKYNLIDEFMDLNVARIKFSEFIEKEVNKKINILIANNQNRIIVLVTDNVLTPDIDKMYYFDKSDLKVLVVSDEYDYECLYNEGYDKERFDYLIDFKEEIDIRKLVKLWLFVFVENLVVKKVLFQKN